MLRTSLLTCALLLVTTSAFATSPAPQPSCGFSPAAPGRVATGASAPTIPANTPSLAFFMNELGGSVDSVTLRRDNGAVAPTTRRAGNQEVLLDIGTPLEVGRSYVVETTSSCAADSQAAPNPVITFTTASASPLPTTMGVLRQAEESLGATAVPASTPTLVLKLSPEALAFLAVTKFNVRIPGDPDPGITSAYGGANGIRSYDEYRGEVVIGDFLGAYCRGSDPAPTHATVSAYLAGSDVPYETIDTPIDIKAFCDEQVALREENERKLAAAAANAPAGSGTGGGCSVSHGSAGDVGILGGLVGVVLAFRRRRRG